MTMNERKVIIEIRIRGENGPQYSTELQLSDPEALQGIIERAAGRMLCSGWENVRQYTALAMHRSLLEWAHKEYPGGVQAARNPVDVLACGLANHERRQRIDSDAERD